MEKSDNIGMGKWPNHLRILRTVARLSQEEVGEITNIPPAYISQYETGKMSPSPIHVLKLSVALGAGFSEMYPDEGERERLFQHWDRTYPSRRKYVR